MPCSLDAGLLAGVDTTTLQSWLTNAQAALARVSTGQQEETVIVTGGGQHREVTFSKTNMGDLVRWIMMLQQALGTCGGRRRAFGVSF
jgi:hypothetical protein